MDEKKFNSDLRRLATNAVQSHNSKDAQTHATTMIELETLLNKGPGAVAATPVPTTTAKKEG